MMFRRFIALVGVLILVSSICIKEGTAQHVDVLAFNQGGQLSVGAFDHITLQAIENRLFPSSFDDFYAVNDPGFTALTGDLPGNVDLQWDFLPMTVDDGPHVGFTSTLLYWDPIAVETPQFGPSPAGHSISLFGKDGAVAVADGGDEIVNGHTIETTSAGGAIHEHRFFFLDDNGDGLIDTLPEAGIYLLAMQLRMETLEDSEPFFFVWNTPEATSVAASSSAVEWVETRLETLVVDDMGLNGDFNVDGAVDARDYTAWRDGLGDLFTSEDFDVWNAAYGSPLEGGMAQASASVPEPTSLLLLATVFCNYLSTRRCPRLFASRRSFSVRL